MIVPWRTRVLAKSSPDRLLLAGGTRRQHALHTCHSKVNHVSVFIEHGPVRIPDGVGKFNQVPKHGRGDDVIELPSVENTQERNETADRWPPCSTPHLRAGCSTLLPAQGRIHITVNILLNECQTTQCEILMSSLCCMNTDQHTRLRNISHRITNKEHTNTDFNNNANVLMVNIMLK